MVDKKNTEQIEKLLSAYPKDAAFRVYHKKKSLTTRLSKKQPNRNVRKIVAPNEALNAWLKKANALLNELFGSWPGYMHGGIKKRSCISHAKCHVGQHCVITVDVKSCFDSITDAMVAPVIQSRLKLGADLCSRLLTKLFHEGRLAQGFATSNFICNLYLLEPLDVLNRQFKSQGLAFSNYVDDIAISGSMEPEASKTRVIKDVLRVLSHYNLRANMTGKIKVMLRSGLQEVCKLKVNTKLTATKKYRDSVFRDVAGSKVGDEDQEAKIRGVIAHLKNVDPKLSQSLRRYALKKGVLTVKQGGT